MLVAMLLDQQKPRQNGAGATTTCSLESNREQPTLRGGLPHRHHPALDGGRLCVVTTLAIVLVIIPLLICSGSLGSTAGIITSRKQEHVHTKCQERSSNYVEQ